MLSFNMLARQPQCVVLGGVYVCFIQLPSYFFPDKMDERKIYRPAGFSLLCGPLVLCTLSCTPPSREGAHSILTRAVSRQNLGNVPLFIGQCSSIHEQGFIYIHIPLHKEHYSGMDGDTPFISCNLIKCHIQIFPQLHPPQVTFWAPKRWLSRIIAPVSRIYVNHIVQQYSEFLNSLVYHWGGATGLGQEIQESLLGFDGVWQIHG